MMMYICYRMKTAFVLWVAVHTAVHNKVFRGANIYIIKNKGVNYVRF